MKNWKNNYIKIDKRSKGVDTINKGSFSLSYLSWTEAVKFCRENNIEYTEKILLDLIEYGVVGVELELSKKFPNGEYGDYTKCIEYLAITDNRHQAIDKPKSTDIANTYKRALAKAISSATGYGFALYTDELVAGMKAEQEPKNVEPKQPLNHKDSVELLANISKLDKETKDKITKQLNGRSLNDLDQKGFANLKLFVDTKLKENKPTKQEVETTKEQVKEFLGEDLEDLV